MKSLLLALPFFLSLSAAAPNLLPRTGDGVVCVHFSGADDDSISHAYYDQCFPANASPQKIYNPLSVTYISVGGNLGGNCQFKGVDGSITYLNGPMTVPVGPPQTQIEGYCI